MNELDMQTKTKRCKYCRTEIPFDAKVCPQCRRKQKKGIGKWIILGIAGLVVLSAIFGGGKKNESSSGSAKTQTEVKAPQETEKMQPDEQTALQEVEQQTTPEAEAGKTYHVGDAVQAGNLKIVYMASGTYQEDNEFLQPEEGNKYVFLKFAFENTSTTSDCSVSVFSFDCFADGYAAQAYYGGEDGLSATLSAGRTTTGAIYFEVPNDAQTIEVEYEENVLTDKKILFAFDGEQDSGYVPELNTQVSDEAYHVGQTVDGKTLKISYLSCQEYTSDNMFVQPKDGYHYVSCEFEFENVGSSDEFVSSLDFDCYADGAACEAVYLADNDLSATISSGRKAKGSVTFEVPKTAQVVEVEYLSNYWTSNRVVFAVE